jgi:hypothetical protein
MTPDCPDCATALDPGGRCWNCGYGLDEPGDRDPDDLATFTALGGALTPAEALDLAHAKLTRYVVFPCPEAADATALYAAATHAVPSLEFAARLVVKSPVKRCGKTRLMDVLAQLVRRPLLTSDISAAALVRSISPDDPPTLMLDEADATFGALKGDEKAEHLRGILNAGFGRDRPYRRWDVTTRSMEDCPTFAMAVLAGIGSLPDTIEDRGVIIELRRKSSAERVAKFRVRRDKPEVAAAGQQLADAIGPHADEIGDAEPDMPPELDDRAEDVWEAMIAVADFAGRDWPVRARKAAAGLSGNRSSADGTVGERLLADLRDVFGDADKMPTAAILDALHKIEEAPWRDWYGHPLTPRDLAKLLRPYGVSSTDVKIGDDAKKGYRREHFYDPWTRYLTPGRGGSATSATSATAQVNPVPQVAGRVSYPRPATDAPSVTSTVAQVAEVAEPPQVSDRSEALRDEADDDSPPDLDPEAEWEDELPF